MKLRQLQVDKWAASVRTRKNIHSTVEKSDYSIYFFIIIFFFFKYGYLPQRIFSWYRSKYIQYKFWEIFIILYSEEFSYSF